MEINRNSADDDAEEGKGRPKKNSAFQTGSEVDRRLRLMLFLSAHLGEEYSLEELAERFIGKPKSDDELKKFVNVIHKDINTLTTVSDDGEMAGSQFFASTGRCLTLRHCFRHEFAWAGTLGRYLPAVFEHAYRIGELSCAFVVAAGQVA